MSSRVNLMTRRGNISFPGIFQECIFIVFVATCTSLPWALLCIFCSCKASQRHLPPVLLSNTMGLVMVGWWCGVGDCWCWPSLRWCDGDWTGQWCCLQCWVLKSSCCVPSVGVWIVRNILCALSWRASSPPMLFNVQMPITRNWGAVHSARHSLPWPH